MENEGIIYGRNPVVDAINEQKEIDKVLILNTIRGPFEKEIRKLCKNFEIPLQYVPGRKLDKLTNKNHQGIIAYSSIVAYQKLENVIPHLFEQGIIPLVLILDGITDVRNFGAICRSAEVLGANCVVIGEKKSARINHDAYKTSSGAILRLPICREGNLSKVASNLQLSGFHVYASSLDSEQFIDDIDFRGPSAVILGSEGEGVSEHLMKICDQNFKIPQVGQTDSLNVSVAAGVILYEILKQRSRQ